MSVRYDGIGKLVVTFDTFGEVNVGDLVILKQNNKVGVATDGQQFCGICVSKNGNYVGVQLKGFATMSILGAAPLGYCGFVAAPDNAIKSSSASSVKFLVVDYSSRNNTVTFIM